ncbi:cAMP-binding domain of CRP or a regulatory subunit of cAMP-dependent protein kinases [Chryseobacterium rhizoplanae]|uniref:cAMP-binding domain of CRP or a regulatory subunit of cAMP-dependent protein kinases n=1 Tax=Chryseobacterium rhizoplanae TaxID=1609531 RepID=A0A521DMG0_9FLAO|nr:Crp/Fnr family transcriptional regulator [Chryseobacterium rhizoplanae]SMO72866.1 cAMP-binding domain of CRP or a regulatory subunit of cAMP-dependent protein kinases [Chryseobacterium rhizoplanae]
MIISEDLLLSHGATYEEFHTKDVIFSEGTLPRFYFQVVKGTVELNNFQEDGREFIQGIISDGQSLGESLLFIEQPYPMNAIAKTDCKILKLPASDFLSLVQQNKDVMMTVFKFMSERLLYKYIMLFSIASGDPQMKIKTLLDYIKTINGYKEQSFIVPYTRQQLANLTGLRVETVIRTIKKMADFRIIRLNKKKIEY